jgi:hypothetical protein
MPEHCLNACTRGQSSLLIAASHQMDCRTVEAIQPKNLGSFSSEFVEKMNLSVTSRRFPAT